MGVPPPELKGAATRMGAKLLRVVCVLFLCVCVCQCVRACCVFVVVCLSVCALCLCLAGAVSLAGAFWFALLYAQVVG